MNKKIIVKALAIAAILVSAVLFVLAGKGILASNRTYDLFRKIRVDLKDVYTEMDDYDLDHVKDTYREAFSLVDQIDEIGGTQANSYLNDTVSLYGLLDTAEVTDQLVASMDQIGTRTAWNVLNESFDAIDKANRNYTAIAKVGAENASVFLTDIESALDAQEDLDIVREQMDTDYDLKDDPDEKDKEVKETRKNKREFFDFVFDEIREQGKEDALVYMKAVADAPDQTSIEFAQQQISKRYSTKTAEDEEDTGEKVPAVESANQAETDMNEQILAYADILFRLASDQGSAAAKTYAQGMLIVSSVNDIGVDKAQMLLDDTYGAIDEAGKVLKVVRTVGTQNMKISISRLEEVLEANSDLAEARKRLDESDAYVYLNKETTKQINALYDFAFEMMAEKGADETLSHLKAAVDAAEMTDEEFARFLINRQYAGQDTQESEEVLAFCEDVFNLISDQGKKAAGETFQNLLDAIKKDPIHTAKEYLYYVYDDKPENQKTRSYLDAIFTIAETEGMEYVKEHGGDICADVNQVEAIQVQTIMEMVDAAAKGELGADAVESVTQIVEAVTRMNEESGGSNTYLTDINKTVKDAAGRIKSKSLKEKKAKTYLEDMQAAVADLRNVTDPEQMKQARAFENDAWALMNRIGLERARKYIQYASSEAYKDKTLGPDGVDRLGTDNVEQLEALNTTDLNRARNKARTIVLATVCLIAGITLLCIRVAGKSQPRMSRKERQELGTHMGLRTSRMIANSVIHAILLIISIIWLIPFISIVLQSLRVESTWQVGYIMPVKMEFYNYINLFDTDFPRWYLNTFIMALVVAVLQTVIVLCMSYTLSRFRFKMRKPLMRLMLILGMFPGMLSMIILYRVLKDMGLTQANAVPGLILVYIASSGMGYYVSKGFFDTIPKSLDEAARVDGATRAQVLYKIILPLAKPIVIYTILTAFMGPWGDYVFARYISFGTSKGMNAAVGLYGWLNKDQIASRYTMFCAGGVLVAIPVAVLFMCLQRYYVEGVTGGAVKG